MEFFESWADVPETHVGNMDRKIFTGKNVMLVRNSIEPRAVVQNHSHPHEQMIIVVSGECDVTSGGETKHFCSGAIISIPSNEEHSVVNTKDERLVAIDIFSPIREDFLEK